MQQMPKRPRRNADFWKRVYAVMERLPAAFPVVVSVVPRKEGENWGETQRWNEGKFNILIQDPTTEDEEVNHQFMADCFQHEYAHALNWSHSHDKDGWIWLHDETWGAWYSRVYRVWTGEN